MVEWSLPRGKISFVDEESYFQKTFNFSREDLKQAWKGTKSPRDFGWWWQQLLKLGAGQCIEGISENFCVWDADLIVLEPWPLTDPNSTQCYVAPLQEKYLSDTQPGSLRFEHPAYPQDGAHAAAQGRNLDCTPHGLQQRGSAPDVESD